MEVKKRLDENRNGQKEGRNGQNGYEGGIENIFGLCILLWSHDGRSHAQCRYSTDDTDCGGKNGKFTKCLHAVNPAYDGDRNDGYQLCQNIS